MKKFFVILIAIVAACPANAQDVIELYPSADCVVGFHDGENSANENAGNASHFSSFWQPAWTGIGENGGYGLIKFDLTAIPPGTLVNSAILMLHAFGDDFSPYLPDGHAGENECWLQRITEDWDEYEATWNTRPNMTSDGQIEVPASTGAYQDYEIDITTFVQDMVNNPSSNFGLALKLQNESPTRGLMFKSSDDVLEANWPKLELVYGFTSISAPQTPEFEINISPNPVYDVLTILITEPLGVNYTVHIINIQGAVVEALTTNSNQTSIGTSHLPAGIYTLCVQNNVTGAYSVQQFTRI